MVNKARELLIDEVDKQIENLKKKKEKMELEEILDKFIEKTENAKNMTPQEIIESAFDGMDKIIDVRNPNYEEKEKLEIIDSNTADIKYLFNDLIDNTGIIEYIRLRFKIGLTPTILETLSKNKTLLTENNIYWEINNPCKDYIELTLEQDK